MTQSTLCCSIAGGYCRRCDVLVGLPGVRVVDAVVMFWLVCLG